MSMSNAARLLTKHLDLFELATLEIQRAVVAVWKRRQKGASAANLVSGRSEDDSNESTDLRHLAFAT